MNTLSRLVVTGLTTATLVAAPVAATATPTIPTTPSSASKPIDCDPNSEFYLADGGSSEVLTHRYGFHMVGHQTKTITQRAKRVKILKTDVDISGDAKLSGNKITRILLTAEASLHGHFSKMSETTEENEITVTDQIKTFKKEGDYVAFAGYRRFSGWWKLVHCEGDGVTKRVIESGYFEAFDPVYKDGFARCPAKRYKFNTLMHEACVQSWE